MRSQRNGAQPANHHRTQTERSCLHSHLKSNRPTQRIQTSEYSLRPSQTIEAELKTKKTRTPHKDYDKNDYHHDTREQRTDTCTQQAHFRQAQLSVYQDIVADNIQHISAEQYPHGGLSIRNPIRKLLEAIELHHKYERSQQNQIIRFYQGNKLFRLSQISHIKIKDSHTDGKQECHQQICQQAVTQRLSRRSVLMSSIQTSHDRGQPVREACTENNHQIEYIIDERGSTQFYRTMMTDHQRIGKPQHDNSYLPDYNGQSERNQCFVMLLIYTIDISHLFFCS